MEKRIKPQQVKKAVDKNDLTVNPGCYICVKDVCGIGAVYYERLKDAEDPNTECWKQADKDYGEDYTFGFTIGFSHWNQPTDGSYYTKRIVQGIEDGKAARKEVMTNA